MLIVVPLALAGCEGSTKFVKPILEDPPQIFLIPCDTPVLLPERDLSRKEVETFWIQDRSNLVECASRHKAAVDYYRDRDGRINGNE